MSTSWFNRPLPAYWIIAASLLSFLLGTGAVWQFFDLRLKSRSVEIEQVRLEKELYERLQFLQNQASSAFPDYIDLRDKHFNNPGNYEVQNAYTAETGKLASLIREYVRTEAKLSILESRSLRFFILPLPPPAPRNLRVDASEDEKAKLSRLDVLSDPLIDQVVKDRRALFKQYGKPFPEEGKPSEGSPESR